MMVKILYFLVNSCQCILLVISSTPFLYGGQPGRMVVTFIKSIKGLFAHLGNELTRAVNQIGPR